MAEETPSLPVEGKPRERTLVPAREAVRPLARTAPRSDIRTGCTRFLWCRRDHPASEDGGKGTLGRKAVAAAAWWETAAAPMAAGGERVAPAPGTSRTARRRPGARARAWVWAEC